MIRSMENRLSPSLFIAEDDEASRGLYSEKFRAEGFLVREASNGSEAWRQLQNSSAPDILFTGIGMPELNGFELIEKVRNDPKFEHTGIFVFSHHGRPEDRARATEIGVDEFVVSGYTPPAEIVLRAKSYLVTRASYRLEINPQERDAPRLISEFRLPRGLLCPRCGSPMLLSLQPDPLRPKQMFSGYFLCPVCDARH